MKPLSSRAQALIATLERPTSMSEKLFGRATRDLSILSALASDVEVGIVPHLLPFVFDASSTISRTAARLLSMAIASADAMDVLDLDELCRRRWSSYYPPSGTKPLLPADVSRFSRFGDDEIAIVGMTSFHNSGWVREAAVTQLDATATGAELPFLLIRLNDWVEPVAERAKAAVLRRMNLQSADAFVDSFPILRRLEISRRRNHAAVLDGIRELLKQPESRSTVERGLEVIDSATRRLLYRVARERPDFDRVSLLSRALGDGDAALRLEGVKLERENMSTEVLAPVLPRIIGDPYPRVRREGIAAAAERMGDDAKPVLLVALLDQNQVVREVARFYLRRRHEFENFAQFYRDRISALAMAEGSRPPLTSALAGLGETGAVADTVLIAPFLTNPHPEVRRASIRAIVSLGIGDELPKLIQMLRDLSPAVSGTARHALRSRAASVGVDALRSVMREGPQIHSRLAAVSLGAVLGKWDALVMLLEAVRDGDERVQAYGRSWLRLWVARRNRSFEQPTANQLSELGLSLATYEDTDPNTMNELRSIYQYWSSSLKPSQEIH